MFKKEVKPYVLKIVTTEERIKKYISIDDFIGIQNDNMQDIKNVLSRFAIDEEGNYYPVEEVQTEFGIEYRGHKIPMKLIGMLTLEKINQLKDVFLGNVKEDAVPPTNASDSADPSSQEPQQPQPG